MNANARLEEAVRAGDLRRVRLALAKGADVSHRVSGGEGNGQSGRSLLGLAAAGGQAAIVRALIEAGARVGVERGTTSSALHEAAQRGDIELLKLLLAADGRRAINRVDNAGYSPLMRAVEGGHLPAVQLLIEAGADPNAGSGEAVRESALRIAAAAGSYEMARVLLAAGADPLIPGRMMLTALDRARERRTPEGRRITALILRTLEQRERPLRAAAKPAVRRRKRLAGRK